ncbi:GPI anchored serine-threonine rich protein [Pyronema omphalodes]|nr:GPI anchored serine-threonine rich protein [Pyronema omphalodes]
MKYSLFAIAAAIISSVQALTTPVGEPTGNPIHTPGMNDIVVAGKPYTITWTPTSSGPISLVLLRGPSSNVKPIATIIESIPNSGSYTWTPSTSLEDDVTHYGIQLIQDNTGAYQYSTQFGVSNKKSSGSSSIIPPYGSSSSAAVTEAPAPTTAAPKPTVIYSTHISTITSCDCESSPASTPASTPATSVEVAPVPVPNPTGSGVPPTYNGNNTQPGNSASPTLPPAVPTFTGAGVKMGGSLVAVAAAAAVGGMFLRLF